MVLLFAGLFIDQLQQLPGGYQANSREFRKETPSKNIINMASDVDHMIARKLSDMLYSIKGKCTQKSLNIIKQIHFNSSSGL